MNDPSNAQQFDINLFANNTSSIAYPPMYDGMEPVMSGMDADSLFLMSLMPFEEIFGDNALRFQ
jgi:hypothetical protein